MKALLAKAAGIATLVILADQATKVVIRSSLALCSTHGAIGCDRAGIAGPVELIRLRNAGSAFGFSQDLWIWVPIALAGLVLVLLYARAGRMTPTLAIAVGLQLAGAAGNLIDRAFLGGVTDFIYLGAGPVFNVADVALFAGTVLAVRALAGSVTTRSLAVHPQMGDRDLRELRIREGRCYR